MTDISSRQPVKRRRTRLVRVGIPVLLLGAVLSVYLVQRNYTNPDRIRSIARDYLQRFFRGRVTVSSAEFSWLGEIRLFNVAVAPASPSPASQDAEYPATLSDPVFTCREVRLTHDPLSTVIGTPRIESIEAIGPTATILHDAVNHRTNLARLFRSPAGERERTSSARLPTIELRDVSILTISREVDHNRIVAELRLNIRAHPHQQNTNVYDIVWQSGDERTASGHSQINLKTGRLRNVRGGLPWMSIEAVMLTLNAEFDGVGAWCELLGLDGTVRAADYNLDGDDPTAGARSARIELKDASISIPIDENDRRTAPHERYLRFEHVRGWTMLTGEGIHAEFSGLFHGSECNVAVTIRGGVEKLKTLDDVDFDASLTVNSLTLPRIHPRSGPSQARFIRRWSKLAGFYRDYDPVGVADLAIDVSKRAGADQTITVRRAVLTAIEGNASCRFFPYRVHGLTGEVEYSAEGVFIRDLSGHHGEGTVRISGWSAQARRSAAKKISISAKSIPIDSALIAALPQRYRKMQQRFNATGQVGVEAHLEQPAVAEGQEPHWDSKAEITLNDASATFEALPYPVHQLSGSLLIDRDRLVIESVKGRSGPARISVDGEVTFDDGLVMDVDIVVSGTDVPIDAVLLSALPAETREWIESYAATGRFDFNTSLGFDPQTARLTCPLDLTLHDTSIRHSQFPLRIGEIEGRLHISNDAIRIEELTGRCDGASITAAGTTSRQGSSGRTDLLISTDGLVVDDALCRALPPRLSDALLDWRIGGPVPVEVRVRTDPATGGDADVTALVRLNGVTMEHARIPLPLSDVRAEVAISGTGIHIENLEATLDGAAVRAGADVRLDGEREEGTITLSATDLSLDHLLHGVLPDRMAEKWKRLQPEGSVDLYLKRLHFHRRDAASVREWSVEGYAELRDVALHKVAGIERVNGTLSGSGKLVDHLGGAALGGRITLSSWNIRQQHLGRTQSPWSYARSEDGQGVFNVSAIEGRIHEGSLTGEVELSFDAGRTTYSLSTTVHSMQIEPFLNADRLARAPESEPVNVRGLLDAHLYLSGAVDDPTSRRGGGRFEILDGYIYRFPLVLAILNVLNLTVPQEDAFSNAKADFFVVDRRVRIRNLMLRGGGLALVGSGSMTLPDRGLDLDLVNVSPNQWARLPVLTELLEGASRELVELHVTGPLSRPTVRPQPFRGLGRELERLFQKKSPKKIQPTASW